MEYKIIIPLNPVTKKNSSRVVRAGKYVKVLPSKAFEAYQDKAGWYFGPFKGLDLNKPLEVKCLFFMQTRRRVDLANLLNGIDDVLVHYGVLADDNSNIITSHDGSRVLYDKDYPRTEIYITERNEIDEHC